MLSLSGSLTFANTTHPALSRPWEWLLNYRPMAFWYTPHYTGAINLSIWLVMIPVVLYMLYRAVKGNEAGLFGFAWFVGTFLFWIPISIFTDRVSFIYYFYPTIGALCLGLGLGLNDLMQWVAVKQPKIKIPVKAGIGVFFLIHIASFIILTPVFLRT
jgi:predicted membrane-bound dolichyl-phosphate-mannose-protein mannosyltransferase